MLRTLAAFVLLSASLFAAPPIAPGKRILILGDSITQGATYVAYVDAAMILAEPTVKYDLISAGLASETVSGLSEPGHAGGQFPRPDLHERLDRVLAQAKPDLVVACYGMNDGIYMPVEESRFKAFRDGMTRLHDKVIATGAKMIHVTPPVFDPGAIPQKVDMSGAPGKNYARYDEVLDRYSDWLIAQRKQGWEVIDLHYPMKTALEKARATDPKFVLAKDGIHPGDEGHRLMAQSILSAWEIKASANDVAALPEFYKVVRQKTDVLRDAWLSAIGHKRPGVKAGLPLEEATIKGAALDTQARELAAKK